MENKYIKEIEMLTNEIKKVCKKLPSARRLFILVNLKQLKDIYENIIEDLETEIGLLEERQGINPNY